MGVDLTPPEPSQDRRVRRSRAALMQAAVDLVTERGTAAIPLSDLADAADVSRKVVYQHFGDRDALLVAAAVDLASNELLARPADDGRTPDARGGALAVARHFAGHRPFYRALMTGPTALAVDQGLITLLRPLNREGIRQLHGAGLTPSELDDIATFVTGGAAAFVRAWVIDGPDPLDPEAFTDRLLRVTSVLHAAESTSDRKDRP